MSGEIEMIKGLILGLQFLTRLPINIRVDWTKENLRRSTFFFPFIGLLIGLIVYGVNYVVSFINQDVAAVFSVLALIALTGGLHLDGLSDMCDGFFSNKEKDQVLDIMKDSRVGAFGVIGLIIILLLKYVLIGNLGDNLFLFLIFSIGNSRAVQVFNLVSKKPARESGIAYMFSSSKATQFAFAGVLLYLVLLVYIDYKMLLPFFINLIFMEFFVRLSYKKIGGINGDILGSIAEMGEIVSLIAYMGVNLWISF